MKQVYQCDFCKEIGDYVSVLVHEKKCWKNPGSKSCTTCMHYVVSKEILVSIISYQEFACKIDQLPNNVDHVSKCDEWKEKV